MSTFYHDLAHKEYYTKQQQIEKCVNV